MFGSSPDDTLTKENCQVLYRPPTNGEEKVHAHSVRRITLRQVYIEKAAEDGTLANPNADPDGHWELSRGELEHNGSAYHTPTRTRFYRSREEAKVA